MVNSGSFDAAGSEGESAKAEFTQVEDGDAAPRSAASPRHLTDFAAVVPDTSGSGGGIPSPSSERDDGLTTPPQATMTTVKTTEPPATPTKASLQCSVPLDKVKNVLEMCRQSQSPTDKTKFNSYFILENYLKQKQNSNVPSATETSTTDSSNCSNSGESSKPTVKRLLCLFCDRTFTSNNLKQKHVDRCHSAGQTRRSSARTSSHNPSATACCFCSKLNQTEHTLKELLEHLINEHSNRYYACLSCQERFNSVQSLREHNKIVHGIEDDTKTCPQVAASDVTSDKDASDKDSSIGVDVLLRTDKKRTKSDVGKSEAQTKSSPTAPGKTLKRNSSLKSTENSDTKQGEQRDTTFGKSVGFHVDFEDSILANIINPEDIKKNKESTEEEEAVSDTIISTRKSRSSTNSKNKPTPSASSNQSTTTKNKSSNNVSNNKKISVKSTKNGVRNLRTTRASVKQVGAFNNNKTRKTSKIIKSDSDEIKSETKQKSSCNPASVFSLVNAYIYKYEKIYDHASDSIKDANSVQFNAVFDRDFYLRTVCNIRDNLLNHVDGKLNRNIESETRISHFEHNPALADAKSTKDSDNFGCDLSLNAVTPVATLLASSQYGEDFDAQIEYGAKASQKKPKKIAVVKYKFPNKKYNSLFRERDGHTDLTSLDMWTQLTVKNRQGKVHDDGSFDSDSLFFDRGVAGFEAKHQVEELNSILDKRGPFEDLLMEANALQFLELRKKSSKDGDYISEEASKDVYFILDEILTRVVSKCHESEIKTETIEEATTSKNTEEDNLEIPHYFQLQRSSDSNSIKIDKTDSIALICSSKDENDKSDKRLELTGEWTRPRIYICAACGLKLPNLKSLGDHKNNDHPHIWCSHYEFVGNQSQIYRHLSIPGLGKVSVIETLPQNRIWQKSDARVCSKCTKQCHNLGELHKHILECGGDWTWMLARKKCKYRPYGARTRRRRQRGYKRTCNPEVSRARELKPKNKPNFIGPRPKPSKPSDAETIERMLANLPPKRNRKMISMRDGIQRPRKPYKQSPNASNSHLNAASKSPNKHFKTNSPQITKQTLRSALKRKLAINNMRKQQKGSDNKSDNNVSLKLRSRITKNDDTDDGKTKDSEPLSNKTKLRNKRMISRILGSKIFDSTTAIVTRRRLVKAITQNNLIRKTRLRTKMLEANAQKLEAQVNHQKDELILEIETSTKVKNKNQQDITKEIIKRKNQNNIEENLAKSESSSNEKTVKKSNSKRLLSVLTKSSKKSKTSSEVKPVVIEDNKPDTISAIIDQVVNVANINESTEVLEKVVDGKKGLRRTRSSSKINLLTNEESIAKDETATTSIESKVDNDNTSTTKKSSRFGKAFGKKTSKFMQNVKSFRKNMKQVTENKSETKNESIASKLIRTFSMRGSKRKKNKIEAIDKTSTVSSENISISSEMETQKDEFKKTTIQDPPNLIEEIKELESLVSNEQPPEILDTILEKNDPLPEEKQISDPVVCSEPDIEVIPKESNNNPELENINENENENETLIEIDIVDDKETDFKQSDEKLNSNSTLNKFKSKMKRSGRGLNDCIAMLKCKLEQKVQIIEPPALVDKSNLFILNSLDVNKHSLGAVESTNEENEILIPTEPILNAPILENSKSQDAIDLSIISKAETFTLKNILEVPCLSDERQMQQNDPLPLEVATVEIETQTVEQDITPSLPEYNNIPHIQSNIQLSSLLNATLKNCLIECVKNKCEELKNETQIVRKSTCTKDRKIGSVRKRRTNKQPKTSDLAIEKPSLNIPLLLNTAFTEKSPVVVSKPKLDSARATTTAEDTSEDDLPLSKLASSSSVESNLTVKLSVAKKKRSAKKQIAFTPLILNSPDTCIPQVSLQERLEQRISLETSSNEKDEIRTELNVPNCDEIPVEAIASSSSGADLMQRIEVVVVVVPSSSTEQSTIIESSNNTPVDQLVADQKETMCENHSPLSEQFMLVEDEPLINYLVNKTLTEANVEQTSPAKNAIQNHLPSTENIELIDKLDCVDSGKENSDIQGIKKQKKSMKKTRGKRRSRGKLNATDSQIDYSATQNTIEEVPEKVETSEESTMTTEDLKDSENLSSEYQDTSIENVLKQRKPRDIEMNSSLSEISTEQSIQLSNEDAKKRQKNPKKTVDMASVIQVIEAVVLSSIQTQNEADQETPAANVVSQKKKRTSRSKIASEEENSKTTDSSTNEESNLETGESPVPDNVVRPRRSRTKSKVNSESNSATPEVFAADKKEEESVVEIPKLDEIPVEKIVKKKRGRTKKVIEEKQEVVHVESSSPSNTTDQSSQNVESEMKRTTRAKPKVNYLETYFGEPEIESNSENTNDEIINQTEIIEDNSEIKENLVQTEESEKKRVTRGKKMNYFETETDLQSDSEASNDETDATEIDIMNIANSDFPKIETNKEEEENSIIVPTTNIKDSNDKKKRHFRNKIETNNTEEKEESEIVPTTNNQDSSSLLSIDEKSIKKRRKPRIKIQRDADLELSASSESGSLPIANEQKINPETTRDELKSQSQVSEFIPLVTSEDITTTAEDNFESIVNPQQIIKGNSDVNEELAKNAENRKKKRISRGKQTLNNDTPESDVSSNTGLDTTDDETSTSLEEMKERRRSLLKHTTCDSETEVLETNKHESFLHPEEIKSKRKSRLKKIELEIVNNDDINLEENQPEKLSLIDQETNINTNINSDTLSSVSSDDSSVNLEENQLKCRSKMKIIQYKQDVENTESNSNFETMSSVNSDESFISSNEIKTKRRYRSNSKTNSESNSDLETLSSGNSNESSTNLEEINIKRKSRSKVTLTNLEAENSESNTNLETPSTIYNDESITNLKEIQSKCRPKTIDNVGSAIESKITHDESSSNSLETKTKRKLRTKFTETIPMNDHVELNTDKISSEESSVNSEDINSKRRPRLKITIANQKTENVESITTSFDNVAQADSDDSQIRRRSRSKITLNNLETNQHIQVFDAIPQQSNDNSVVNYDNIKNKLKSILKIAQETENVESNTDIEIVSTEENPTNYKKLQITSDNNNAERVETNTFFEIVPHINNDETSINTGENRNKRTPKLKINFPNSDTENFKNTNLEIVTPIRSETNSLANSVENILESSGQKEKKKRRSFIKIKLNLPEPREETDLHVTELNDSLVEPDTTTPVIISGSISTVVENKKKRRSRKKELELLGANIIEDHVQRNDIIPVEKSEQNLENLEFTTDLEINKKISSEFINNEKLANASVTIENIAKLPDEISPTKPEPKKRGRKPKNLAKINANTDAPKIFSNLNSTIQSFNTPDSQIQLETKSKELVSMEKIDSTEIMQPLKIAEKITVESCVQKTTEIDEVIAESERKSRRSRPKINYLEIENDESTELSSDSELSVQEPIQNNDFTIHTEDLMEHSKTRRKSNSISQELENVEKIYEQTSDQIDKSIMDEHNMEKEPLSTEATSEMELQVENVAIISEIDAIQEGTKQKRKRGRKKALVIESEDSKKQEDVITAIASNTNMQQDQNCEIRENVEKPKPKRRGRPSTKVAQQTQELQLQNFVSAEITASNPNDTYEIDVVAPAAIDEIIEEESRSKRKSRTKVNYLEIENPTSLECSSDIDLKSGEEIHTQPVINTEELIAPIVPKKRGRKPKRKNIIVQEFVVSTPLIEDSVPFIEDLVLPVETLSEILVEDVATNDDNEYKKKRSHSKNRTITEEVLQNAELKNVLQDDEQLPILKIDMKKRRHRTKTLDNQSETEHSDISFNAEEFNDIEIAPSVSNDESAVNKLKKKRRSRSKNSETMSQQNIASAIELLTNVENTIESLKEFTKDKPLPSNFKSQLQENIEYEPECVMECKNIQDLTSIPNLNVTVAVAASSDSEDELPLSILIKNKPEVDDFVDSISKEDIPEIGTVVNESSLISENSLLNDIDVAEMNFAKAENKLILSTHNSFDFDDDNIIDQEELSQLVDITSETLLDNIEDDYISTIAAAKEIATITTDKMILNEIKQVEVADENDLDGIIEDLEIVTKCIEPSKTDYNIEDVHSENLTTKLDIDIDKSADKLLTLIDANEESEFIKTPDLKDTSLIIKIKKNFNVHIRKAKKGRRRVIPKSLNRSNVKRKEEEDVVAVCEICNKSFKRKETLASHKKTLTHIAKLSEIEARETQAKRVSDNMVEVSTEMKINEVEKSKETNEEIELEDKVIEEIKCPKMLCKIVDDVDESSCEIIDVKTENIIHASDEDKTVVPVEEILNVAPQKPVNNILPSLIVNRTNSTLKLIDIINEVLDKPVSNLNMGDSSYSPQSIRKSPNSCDSTETFSEPKRYKSLGERKSFDSDSYTMTPKSNDETKSIENFNTIKPITNGEILCKQISILENIIEETNPSLNNYIDDDDSVSLSSSQFEEPLPEPNISDKDLDYTKFTHTADVLSSLIKPNNHFNNFENISESFTKPMKHREDIPAHSEVEVEVDEECKKKTTKDNNTTRKILNRDEELFLECCSLLKSGSEISGSKKSTKQIQLNNFSRSNDASWIIQKQQNSDRFIQRDSYSWLAQSSRVETPIGEPFVNNDWSNSNSAVSSEWLAQKAPSPDRPTESNTILKKSNNNSEESTKYTDLRFEDISIDSSLETSKTLMAVEHSNTENVPLDFHHVDFTNSSLQQTHKDKVDVDVDETKEDEDASSRDEFDAELKKKVVSAFGGLMAKALSNRLHAVVRKSKKSIRGKRDLESTIQSSITDYTIPMKKNKPNQTDSDSSDCPKKLMTKGAMKVFEGIKVSIPTQDLNLKEVLNCSTKTKKLDVETNVVVPENNKVDDTPQSGMESVFSASKNGKIKHLFGRFGNKLGLREKKKTIAKRRSPKLKNHPISKSIDDVYEFEESQDHNSKSAFSLFKNTIETPFEPTMNVNNPEKLNDNNELEKWNADSESDTDRYYDSMSFEEQSLSSESTPEQSNTPVKTTRPAAKKTTEKSKDNQKKCMIMGRIFKNASKPKLEDKIPEIRDFTTSEENSKVVENYLDSCSSMENVENKIVEQPPELLATVPNNSAATNNNANKMSKKEMDMLFDKLLEEEMKMHEKEKLLAAANNEKQTETVQDVLFSKPLIIHSEKKKLKDNKVKIVCKPKPKRQRHNSDSTSSDEFRLGGRQSKSTKKHKTHRKPSKPKKESGINLEQEMKECIGVAGRKSQRKCTSGKQNVLVEFWSSDESSFEEVLSLIEKQNESSKPTIAANVEHVNDEDDLIDDQKNDDDDDDDETKNSCIIDIEEMKKPSLDIYDFESDAESKIEEFHPKTSKSDEPEESEFLAVNKMKIPKRIPKPKRNRKHSKNHDDESASEYEAEKTRRRNEHKRRKMLENDETGDSADCLAVSRRKRNAGDQLYYWSSSSDDEMQDLIEVKPIREDTDDDRPMHHGWIVGDSPKKLVTMLAQAKGKKIDGESVKEQGKKNRVTL